MADVNISVGMLEDGSLITIGEYDRRIHKDAVLCPHCRDGSKLFGRQGEIRRHSFVHYNKSDCRASPENDLHVLVQEEIASGADIALPDFISGLAAISMSQTLDATAIMKLTGCIKEARYPAHDGIPACAIDVEGVMPNGVRLLIEVTVTHKTCDPEALLARAALLRPCVEFRCSDLVGTEWTRSSIREALMDPDRWRWFQLPIIRGRMGNFEVLAQCHPDGDLLVRLIGVDKAAYFNLFHANGGMKGFTEAGYGRDGNSHALNQVKMKSLSELEKRSGLKAVDVLTSIGRSSFMEKMPSGFSGRFGIFPCLEESRRKDVDPRRIALARKYPPRPKRKSSARQDNLFF